MHMHMQMHIHVHIHIHIYMHMEKQVCISTLVYFITLMIIYLVMIVQHKPEKMNVYADLLM